MAADEWPLTLFGPALHQVQLCPRCWGQSDTALENSESKLQQIALLILRKSDLMLGDLSPLLPCCSFWLLEKPILKYNDFLSLPITLPILWEMMFSCSWACSGMCPGMPKYPIMGEKVLCLCGESADQCLQTTGGWGAQVCDNSYTGGSAVWSL